MGGRIHTCNLCNSDPGKSLSIVVGDTIYFDADDGSTGRELWAYNTSNETSWQVINIGGGSASSNPGNTMEILVGDTIYFNAYDSNTGYYGMWAHNIRMEQHGKRRTSNHLLVIQTHISEII